MLMPMIGFSTGALALGDFDLALRMLATKCAEAVELSALRRKELPSLLEAIASHLPEYRRRYKYVAFHAPTDDRNEKELVEQLKGIADRKINIVVHPDIIHDFPLWAELGSFLCVENMDSRKSTGRTAKELRVFFQNLPTAKLCFDIAHARQVDPTMTEAEKILSEFRNRLAHVHLSEVNSQGKHFSASFAAKRAYGRFARILSSVPIILESPSNEESIDWEIEETKNIFLRPRARSSDLESTTTVSATVHHANLSRA